MALTASAAALKTVLDRPVISMGESATLSLVFEGDRPASIPRIPAPANLQIQYTGQSQNISIVNGQTTVSTSLSYLVVPSQPGEYVISAISVAAGPSTLRSQPVKLTVVKATEVPDASGQLAFLEMSAPKTNLYVGEMVPVEVRLYVTAGEGLQVPQIPAEGFVLGKMPQNTQTRAQRNNTIYTILTFQLTATPMKAGSLTLGPAECSLTLHIPQRAQQRRQGNIFDDFFEGMGPRYQRRPVVLKSRPIVFEVSPLPAEGRPPGFSGAVGEFTFTATASPTNLNAGDPITLKAQVTGSGALDTVSLPPQDHWQNFKVYPPTSAVEPSDSIGSAGVKTFEQVIMPQSGDVAEIPAIAFSYFNPRDRRYHTITHPPTPITVQAASGGAPQPVVYSNRKTDDEEPPPATRDIVHIKQSMGVLAAAAPALALRPWFVILQLLPLCFWLGVIIWRKQADMLANNPRLRRKRKVDQVTAKGLRDLERLAQERNSEEFFATMFRLLQEQIGERLDRPASAITEAVLDDEIQAAGASPDLARELRDLFSLCNLARYAPSRTQQELAELAPRVGAAISELKGLKEPGV